MGLEFGFQLSSGLKRRGKANQDSLIVVLPGLFSKERLPLFIVADGMGGYQGGEIASKLVVERMQVYYRKHWKQIPPDRILVRGILNAHQAIKQKSTRRKKLASMGSTVVAAIVDIKSERCWIANVGDSRAYLIDAQKITQVSYDHSKVADLQRKGVLTPEEARNHPKKNILSMSLTPRRETVEPFVTEAPFSPGSVLLLCSDGLWGVISETVIQYSALELEPQIAARKLVEKANTSGGPDNISVVIARRPGEAKAYQRMTSHEVDTIPR
jgi:serine/threonine protein phosphatase PrpC